MKFFNSIVSNFDEYRDECTSLAEVAREYGFERIDSKDQDIVPGDRYSVYKAQKEDDNKLYVIEIKTRDNYRSFGDDSEPYINTLQLWENDTLVVEKSYVYYK